MKETEETELKRSKRQKLDSTNGNANENEVQGNTANWSAMNTNAAPSTSFPNMNCNPSNACHLTDNAHANPNTTLLDNQTAINTSIRTQQQPYPLAHFHSTQSTSQFAQNLVNCYNQFLPLTHPNPVSFSPFTQHPFNSHNQFPPWPHHPSSAPSYEMNILVMQRICKSVDLFTQAGPSCCGILSFHALGMLSTTKDQTEVDDLQYGLLMLFKYYDKSYLDTLGSRVGKICNLNGRLKRRSLFATDCTPQEPK